MNLLPRLFFSPITTIFSSSVEGAATEMCKIVLNVTQSICRYQKAFMLCQYHVLS